jgi:phenylacetate-CoA ligase
MAERVTYASECAEHNGHHLNSDYGITEFLNHEHEPVAPGEPGKIVATSLHNCGMPFLRYETNDVCALKSQRCGCGRIFPLMDDVATKNESIVTLPDGRLISPSVLTHPFKPMHHIVESQIVQEQVNELTIKIVKGAQYSQDDELRLLTAFRERLGEQITIHVQYVDALPRTTNGKFAWVVSRVPVSI